MKRLLYAVALSAFLVSTASAQLPRGTTGIGDTSPAIPCQRYEFAELDAMAKEELLGVRCEWRKRMFALLERGYPMRTVEVCLDEQQRIDRIVARKYELGIDPAAYRPQIKAMCGEDAKH